MSHPPPQRKIRMIVSLHLRPLPLPMERSGVGRSIRKGRIRWCNPQLRGVANEVWFEFIVLGNEPVSSRLTAEGPAIKKNKKDDGLKEPIKYPGLRSSLLSSGTLNFRRK